MSPPAEPPAVDAGSESPTNGTSTSGAFTALLVMINRAAFGPNVVGRNVTSTSVVVDGDSELSG